MAGARSDEPSGARPDGGFDPDSVTGWTLVRAYHLVARRFHATLAEVGLTPTHVGVLVHVSQHPGNRPGRPGTRRDHDPPGHG